MLGGWKAKKIKRVLLGFPAFQTLGLLAFHLPAFESWKAKEGHPKPETSISTAFALQLQNFNQHLIAPVFDLLHGVFPHNRHGIDAVDKGFLHWRRKAVPGRLCH